MGLFGKNEEKDAENEAMKAEYARLEALSLLTLAEEILVRGYGPGGPGEHGSSQTISDLTKVFNPGKSIFGLDERVRSAFPQLISEGVQVLEHARLLVVRFSGGDHSSLGYALTRAGTEVLAGGDVAARIAAVLAPPR
jgi:hypothetical protein